MITRQLLVPYKHGRFQRRPGAAQHPESGCILHIHAISNYSIGNQIAAMDTAEDMSNDPSNCKVPSAIRYRCRSPRTCYQRCRVPLAWISNCCQLIFMQYVSGGGCCPGNLFVQIKSLVCGVSLAHAEKVNQNTGPEGRADVKLWCPAIHKGDACDRTGALPVYETEVL